MLPILLAAAAAGISLLRRKTRKNPVRRLSGHRRVERKNPDSPILVLLHMRNGRAKYLHRDSLSSWGKVIKIHPTMERLKAVRYDDPVFADDVAHEINARLASGLAPKISFASAKVFVNPCGSKRKNPNDDYVLKNRIAHLRGLIREAPAEDKVKLREILKSEQLKLMKPRKNPLYPVVMPRPDEVSDMSVREMREFLAEHSIDGNSFGNKRLRKEVRRVIHKSARRNPSEAFAQGEEIRKQVGSKALFMMGAKHLVAGSMESAEDGKSYPAFGFQVGRNAGKVTHVRIYLLPNDEYRVTFLAVRGTSARVVKNIDGVYADNLHSVLEDVTGMRMSLNPRKNPKKRRSTRKAKR